MSSRNIYLSRQERKDAVILYNSLLLAKSMVKKGVLDSFKVISGIRNLIRKLKAAKVDYISLVYPETLAPVKKIKEEVLVLLAVFIGKTRLIDNILIKR
jgi:pantoate--beta-alanine ligase